mgnify:FL=1
MSPSIINWIMTIKPPYNINAAAELALLTSLDDIDYLKNNVQSIIEERSRMSNQLSAIDGLRALESSGNFLLVESPQILGSLVYERLASNSIFVRVLSDPRLSNYTRISIGTRDQNDRVIQSLGQIIENGSK